MKLSEFREKAEASQRANTKGALLGVGSLMLFGLGGAALGPLVNVVILHRAYDDRDSIAVPVCGLIGTVAGFIALFFFANRGSKKEELPCPSCKKHLGHQPHSGAVIASRHCPFCGARVIED